MDDVETMASRFSISKEVIIRRLLDTNRFSKDEYNNFADEIRQTLSWQKEEDKLARQEGRGKPVLKNVSREAIDKTSPTICRVLLIGYSDGYFSKQEVSGFLRIKEKHIPNFLAEVSKW